MPTLASFGNDLKVFSYHNGNLEQSASYTYKGDAKNLLGGRVNWAGNTLLCSIEETGVIPVLKYNEDSVEVVRRIPTRRASAATFFNWTNAHLVSGDLDGNVSIWDVKNKKTTTEFFSKETSPVKFLSVNADDKYIASAGTKDVIQLYSCTTNQLVKGINLGIAEEISDLKFSPIRKSILACGTLESSLLVCDVTTGATTSHFKNTHPGACTGFTFSPTNSNILVSVSLSQWLKIHDQREKKKVFELNMEKPMTCVDMLKNDPIVFLGTVDGFILALDLRSSAILGQVSAHSQRVTSLKASNTDALNKMKQFKNADINTPETSPAELAVSYGDIYSPVCNYEHNFAKEIESLNKVNNDSPIGSFLTNPIDCRIIRNSTPNTVHKLSNSMTPSSFQRQIESPEVINNLLRSSLSLGQNQYLNDLSLSLNSKQTDPVPETYETKVGQNTQFEELLAAFNSLKDSFIDAQTKNERMFTELKAGQEANRNLLIDILHEITTLSKANQYEHVLTRHAFESEQ